MYLNGQNLLKDFEKQNNCNFITSNKENTYKDKSNYGSDRATLSFNNKVLILRYGDIVK